MVVEQFLAQLVMAREKVKIMKRSKGLVGNHVLVAKEKVIFHARIVRVLEKNNNFQTKYII
jgi:hypothetical protein